MSLSVRPVLSRRDLKLFIRLPWSIYRDDPHWVPPLIAERKRFLDPNRNPFFKHAEVRLFLALRGGRPVGRISAQIDYNFNSFHNNRWGLFGLFECENDTHTAHALVETAAEWLSQRGCDRIVGPMDFTTNDPCGLLVDGRHSPPPILTPWNPDYYRDLLNGEGFTKAMDLLMWSLEVEDREKTLPVIWDLADRVESQHGITVRPVDKRNLEVDVERFIDIYNSAWAKNWGFVPLDEEEVRHYAKELKPLLDENWAFIAEGREGETVGVALTLPDYNQVLLRLKGKLLPFGWVKLLYYRRRIDRVRVFTLGVRPEYQHLGVAAKFYQCHFDSAERTGVTGGEMGWILETNHAMNQAMEAMGGKVVRRYRVYERQLRPEQNLDS